MVSSMVVHSLKTYVSKEGLNTDDYMSILACMGKLHKTMILQIDEENAKGIYTVASPGAIIVSNDLQNAMQRSLSILLGVSYLSFQKPAFIKTRSVNEMRVKDLVQYIDRNFLSNEDIMTIFMHVGKVGDVIAYKMDGERPQKRYTVIISFHNAPMSTIRADSETLQEGVQRVLKEYCKLEHIT